ncbi:MAG: hypothetical protein VX727_01610 [Planctomycetota bacterium]|nr:hypothetical protein [Planctomycetota bacterium]
MIHRTLITILAIASAAVAAPQNTICPVMPDEAITDTDNVVEYQGKEIALCCGRCVRQWNAMDDAKRQGLVVAVMPAGKPDAPKPAAKPAAAETEVPLSQLDPLGLCPKSGSDVAAMGRVTRRVINGVDVSFCCPPCIKPYEDDYAAYRKRIGDQIVVLELAYYPTDRCIVTGRELGKETAAIDHVLGNRLVRVADEAAVARLEADPDTYNQKLDRIIIEAERKDYPLTTCVVQGSTLDPKRPPAEVVVGNRLMKLCCAGCAGKIRATPYLYVQKVNEAWSAAGEDSGS